MNIKNFFIKRFNLIIDKLKKNYKNKLAIAAIIKNEAPYIKEWIEYHKLVGVEKFYIYDNESTDNTKEILSAYIKSGEVIYKSFPGERMQCKAYNHAVKNYKFECKYIAFIDIDEFILPLTNKNIFETVEDKLKGNPKTSGLAVQWLIFGSSGHKTQPNGLVIENYTLCAQEEFDYNKYVKTIANPRKINYFTDPHFPVYYKGFHNINSNGEIIKGSETNNKRCYKDIRINHYFTKSYEEFIRKRERGRSTSKGKHEMSAFYNNDKNDIKDLKIIEYAEQLKENLYK